MRPLGTWRFTHVSPGRVCYTLFLLFLTWPSVELVQTEVNCVEAPGMPTMTRCTRCARDEMPYEDDELVQDPLPPSTEYCLKGYRRFETQIEDIILNMTLIAVVDQFSVSRLISPEEIRLSREPPKDCRKSETPEINPYNDMEGYEQCQRNNADELKGNCSSQLTNGLNKLISFMSTKVGQRSLPSCEDFEDYTEENDFDEGVAKFNTETSTETAPPKLWVLRDRQTSNVSFHSLEWIVEGKKITLLQRTIGYNILSDWFSEIDCIDDEMFGDVEISISKYPEVHLVANLAYVKGPSTTVPGLLLRQIRGNLSRTGDEEFFRMGDRGQRLVASYFVDECNVEEIVMDGPFADTAGKINVDSREVGLNYGDLFREDILKKVKPEIIKIDVGEAEGKTVEDLKEGQQEGCKLSAEELVHLEENFGVNPNSFVRSVIHQQTRSPVYSTYSNRTSLRPLPNYTIEVIQQFANSSTLPAYDHNLLQVTHRSKGREWERVLETGTSFSMSVSAETRATLMDYYKKTFTFYSKKGPLQVHFQFSAHEDFIVRFVRPLAAWELILHLRVFGWMPLHATFRADELRRFLSFREPTHPIMNATLSDAGDSGITSVKWQITADSTHQANLLQMIKDLVNTLFGKSEGAQESDEVLDMLANIATGSTKEEQRRGKEIVSEELISMVKVALDKITAFSSVSSGSPSSVYETLVTGWRALWDILSYSGVVAERGDVTPREGEFLVDLAHGLNYMSWVMDDGEC